ncbi:MAG: DUF4126 domain-containing protein [Candidatus Auribacterota bacterium]
MDTATSTALLLGGSYASGVNLYLTAAGLGIAHRLDWLQLPGELETLANPLIIGIAVLMYIVEFFADKIPYVDSGWDTIHTLIRPLGGAALGYMALSDAGPVLQYPVSLLTGAIALESHLTKATARLAINTSPEPVTNSVASVSEDVGVLGALYLIIKHPVVIAIVSIILVIFSIWFLIKMSQLVKKIFSRSKPTPSENMQTVNSTKK